MPMKQRRRNIVPVGMVSFGIIMMAFPPVGLALIVTGLIMMRPRRQRDPVIAPSWQAIGNNTFDPDYSYWT